jgi:histidinol-phosphate aminotransferase
VPGDCPLNVYKEHAILSLKPGKIYIFAKKIKTGYLKQSMFSLDKILRENIKSLKPYSSARDEYTGKEAVFLDANENPYDSSYNRYPDPLQAEVKERISSIKGIKPGNIFLGNGSDESIDLLIRAFCEPRIDNIVSVEPTYGMYKVLADINDIEFITVLLTTDFELDIKAILEAADNNTKLVFLCSPNNPTANSFKKQDIITILKYFEGIVVVDEAYIDFSTKGSLLPLLGDYKNLVILQTFSKAWGLAGIRLGMAFAASEIINVLNRIKYPYNISSLTLETANKELADDSSRKQWIERILNSRNILVEELNKLPVVIKVYPSDANFLLVRMNSAKEIYEYLVDRKIIVRDRSNIALCEECLRITIGTEDENNILLDALKEYIEILSK